MMNRYGLSLKLDMENAAFDTQCAWETARILHNLADRIEAETGAVMNSKMAVGGNLFDVNGNSCGSWEAKKRSVRQD